MALEETKLTTEVRSIRELNLYLKKGWVLILSYVKHGNDTQEPRFVLGWQSQEKPDRPELLEAPDHEPQQRGAQDEPEGREGNRRDVGERRLGDAVVAGPNQGDDDQRGIMA